MTGRAACAALVGLVMACPSMADAEVLCRSKRGQLVARETCRKKEQPVDGSAFGTPGPQGPSGAPGSPGEPAAFPLRLVDANDVELGRILTFYPSGALVVVEHPSVPTPLTFNVSRSGFLLANNSVYYPSNDCSGVPYMLPGNPSTDQTLTVAPLADVYGTAAYYPTGPVQQVSYASQEYLPSGGAPCGGGDTPTAHGSCCRAMAGTRFGVVAATRILLSTFGFEPPFRAVPR